MSPQPTRGRISAVEPLRDCVLRLGLTGGSNQDVDLEPEQSGPMFEPLRDADESRKVAVESELGTTVRPNGADLGPDVLHGGRTAAETPPPTDA